MSSYLLTPEPQLSAGGHQTVVTLGRRYRFSASHRLHSDRYDDTTNRTIFGKCNNPHGHGHNYTVELLFRGPVDPTTGMVVDLAALDQFAQQHLVEHFDLQNLNTLPCFDHTVPSTENLTLEIYRIFRHLHSAELVSVHVEETLKNSFTYSGPTAATETVTVLDAGPATHERGTDLVSGTESHSGVL